MDIDNGTKEWREEATDCFWKAMVSIAPTEMVRNSIDEWKQVFGPAFDAANEFLGPHNGSNRASQKVLYPDPVAFYPCMNQWGSRDTAALVYTPGVDDPKAYVPSSETCLITFYLARFLRRIALLLGLGIRKPYEIAPNIFSLGFPGYTARLDKRYLLCLDSGPTLQLLLERARPAYWTEQEDEDYFCDCPDQEQGYRFWCPAVFLLCTELSGPTWARKDEDLKRLGSSCLRVQDILKVSAQDSLLHCVTPLSNVAAGVDLSDTAEQRGAAEIRSVASPLNEFSFVGDGMWRVRFQGGSEFFIQKCAGMPFIACLLRTPNRPWGAEGLMLEVYGSANKTMKSGAASCDDLHGTDESTAQELMSQKDIRKANERKEEIKEMLDIHSSGRLPLTPLQKSELEEELASWERLLKATIKKGGVSGSFDTEHDKNVNRITMNLRRACERIACAELEMSISGNIRSRVVTRHGFTPDKTPLAYHLDRCIQTGGQYCYRPDTDISWNV